MRDALEILSYRDTARAHLHQHTQIVLPLSGQLNLEVEGQQANIQLGQACMISKQQAHTHLALEDNQCLILNALPVWDEKLISTKAFIDLTPQAQTYLPFLASLVKDNDKFRKQQALALLESLLPIPNEHIFKSDQRLQKAIHLLKQIENLEMSIAQVAQEVHLSQSQLTVLFKRHLQVTPKQYQRAQQLKQAKYWLQQSNKSLEQVAEKVGLSNASALVRLFRQYENTTPGQYRLIPAD
ncbi:AraC family transcriptional regulator [Marinomonas sp. THO17]|uniref:helix-turn-helix transcriptional regulator n=1 Tax=Marinomonas sp. THO17 TaxID=3149048 RepID=UPI00336BD920